MPRASKNTNSYYPQGWETKYKIAARQTTIEEFVTNTMLAGAMVSLERVTTSLVNRAFQYKDI